MTSLASYADGRIASTVAVGEEVSHEQTHGPQLPAGAVVVGEAAKVQCLVLVQLL